MARLAKANTIGKPTPIGRTPGRPAGAKTGVGNKAASISAKRTVAATEAPERRKPGRPAKTAAPALPQAAKATKLVARSPAVPPAPKVSKDELRAQVERLEQLVANLRAKSREANKAAKAATARISELEAQVVQLEKKAAASVPVSARQVQAKKPPRAKRQRREIDPGDAVPPGVAVQEPAPLDEEAEITLKNLE
ncbi:hypothetical protein ACELLULO517_22190 [Acidisoma cellulosilytica]|uniref:Uncharacterized protein n=1 Tax=Acidisoma cellulosilyticum TaxID=2802395 RepID=A0A964E5W7_9PROT|nr:hypothetical protein [Acidisoma cellulosilyticum]MCB8882974.1 hypothetical protein [Acidisoma cellulosilyticum]